MIRKKLIYRKLYRFIHLSPPERRAFLEAAGMLLIARLAVLLLPFRWIAPRLGTCMAESSHEPLPELNYFAVTLVQRAIFLAGCHMPWKSTCLVRAIAGKFMLRRQNLPNTLYLGVMRAGTRNMAAHAWLRSGNHIVTGGEEIEKFTVVTTFSEP